MTNDCKTAVPEKAKSIYPAAIVATIFVFWFSLPSAGFMAFALVIPVAIWMLFQLVHAIRHSEARKYCALRVGVWFLAFALVFGINAFRDWNMRRQANAIITKIQDYRARHGTCPATLAHIGESRESLKEKLGYSGYACKAGHPILHYGVPYIIYETYDYDFERNIWVHYGG